MMLQKYPVKVKNGMLGFLYFYAKQLKQKQNFISLRNCKETLKMKLLC